MLWDELTDPDIDERLRLAPLFLALSKDGVRARFPTEMACYRRLEEVRWPSGSICDDCDSRDVSHLTSRNLFVCRSCQRQFSATTRTPLHRTRVGLRTWFHAIERIVWYRIVSVRTSWPSDRGLGEILEVDHKTARGLRKVIDADLDASQPGLLQKLVATDPICPPPDILTGTSEHRAWLAEQVSHRIG